MYYSARGIFDMRFSKAEEMGVFTLSTQARPGDHICARRHPGVAKAYVAAQPGLLEGGVPPSITPARDPVWQQGIRGKEGIVYDVVGESEGRAKVRESCMDAFLTGAVVGAIIRYERDSDICRSSSQDVAEYLCHEVDRHPAAYSMVCGDHGSFATWCRLLRYDKELERTFSSVSSALERIDPARPARRGFKGAHLLCSPPNL